MPEEVKVKISVSGAQEKAAHIDAVTSAANECVEAVNKASEAISNLYLAMGAGQGVHLDFSLQDPADEFDQPTKEIIDEIEKSHERHGRRNDEHRCR